MDAHDLARALVAHAAAHLPGDAPLDLPSIRDTLMILAEDPLGKRALDMELGTLNAEETKKLVHHIIRRVIVEIEDDARKNAARVSVVMQPWQAASIAMLAATILGFAAGTLTLPWAAPTGGVLLVAAGVSSWVRNETAASESALKRKADLVKLLL